MNSIIDRTFDAAVMELREVFLQKSKLSDTSFSQESDFQSGNLVSNETKSTKNQKEMERAKMKLNIREEAALVTLDHLLGTLMHSSKSFLLSSLNLLLSNNGSSSITKIVSKGTGRVCYHVSRTGIKKLRGKPHSLTAGVIPLSLSFGDENSNFQQDNFEKYVCLGTHYCSCSSFVSSVYYGISDNNLCYGEKRFKCIHLFAIYLAELLLMENERDSSTMMMHPTQGKTPSSSSTSSFKNEFMKVTIVADEKFADHLLLNFPDLNFVSPSTIFNNFKIKSDEIDDNMQDNEMDDI